MVAVDRVVVAVDHLDEAVTRHVAAACDRLRVTYQPWSGGGPLPDDEPVSLLIAGLPAGSRQVPADVLRLCTEMALGTPLLLLCQERLVTPTVSLHDGQIVLVGPPLTADRVYGRMAVLRAERGVEAASISTLTGPRDDSPLWTRERLYDDTWAASIGCRGDSEGPQLQPLIVSVPEGLTALLPTNATTPLASHEQLIDWIGSANGRTAKLALMRDAVAEASIVHYDRLTEEWLFAWTRPDWPLWIYSDERMPRCWDVGAALASDRVRALKAFAGDLVVGLSGSLDRGTALSSAMARGGHSLLAVLETELVATPRPLAGIILEGRR